MAKVNFTMLAHNRPKLTAQSLRSLDPDPTLFNTLVLLDNPQDLDMRNLLTACPGVEYYLVDGPFIKVGTGSLRNEVIDMSQKCFGRKDYLYLSDNDVFFYPAFMEKMVMIYERAWELGFKVLGAVNHPYHQPIATVPILANPGGVAQFETITNVDEVQALALQSMLMKWEVWDKYGPFDNTPPGRVRMSEDVAFTNKIKADGGRIGVVRPALAVNTGITDSFGEKIPGWELVQKLCPMGVYCE